jgi:iron complex outermembrane recepter protein
VIAPYQAVFGQFDPADPSTRLAANPTFNNVAPEATLTWKAADDVTVYGAYKRGFKSGGFSGSALYSVSTTVDDLAFDPEKAAGFEGGVKSKLLDGSLRLNVAAYYYKYTDLQVDFFDAANIQFITTNVGSAITRGVEVDAAWSPASVDGLTFDASAAYSDSYYDKFHGAPCFGGQTPAQGCTINPANNRPEQDLSGEPTALAPEWVASVRANYTRPIGGGLIAGVSFGPRYSSSYRLNAFGNPRAEQDAYVAWDGGLRLGSEDERWEVSLIGKNLTDKYILTYGQDAPSTGGGSGTDAGFASDQYGNPVFPRTVLLQFSYRYD